MTVDIDSVFWEEWQKQKQVVAHLQEKVGQQDATIAELRGMIAEQREDMQHLEESVRALQLVNSGLNMRVQELEYNADRERAKLKQRIGRLEQQLRDVGLTPVV